MPKLKIIPPCRPEKEAKTIGKAIEIWHQSRWRLTMNKTTLSIIIILLFAGSNQVVSDITEIHNTL